MSIPISPERRNQLIEFLYNLGLKTLKNNKLKERELSLIDEALTHTSAGLGMNHEKLEFLGDAVLRLAASEYLLASYSGLTVGQSSSLRAQLVSDRWLAEVGQKYRIETVLRMGTAAISDNVARQTLRAEATEALIGALYCCWGNNLEPIHYWLKSHWEQSSIQLLADPHCYNWKAALQEWSQSEGLGLPSYDSREINQSHGDPARFSSAVFIEHKSLGTGFGGSRRDAEQQAARYALKTLKIQITS